MNYKKKDLQNALMIIGISFIISSYIILKTTILGLIPNLIGGMLFGYGFSYKLFNN